MTSKTGYYAVYRGNNAWIHIEKNRKYAIECFKSHGRFFIAKYQDVEIYSFIKNSTHLKGDNWIIGKYNTEISDDRE